MEWMLKAPTEEVREFLNRLKSFTYRKEVFARYPEIAIRLSRESYLYSWELKAVASHSLVGFIEGGGDAGVRTKDTGESLGHIQVGLEEWHTEEAMLSGILYLHGRGALDLKARDRFGRTPLSKAITHKPKAARLLFLLGADPNEGGPETPLRMAHKLGWAAWVFKEEKTSRDGELESLVSGSVVAWAEAHMDKLSDEGLLGLLQSLEKVFPSFFDKTPVLPRFIFKLLQRGFSRSVGHVASRGWIKAPLLENCVKRSLPSLVPWKEWMSIEDKELYEQRVQTLLGAMDFSNERGRRVIEEVAMRLMSDV